MDEGDPGGRRPDSAQLVRQWAILRLLAESGRAFSVKELADQLDTSKSSVQRDLATLERDFALVEEREGKQKKVYRVDGRIRALESIAFGTMELLAVHAAAATAPLETSPFSADLDRVRHKIRGFLSPRHNGGLDDLARVFQPHVRGAIDYREHEDTIDAIADAIAQRRWVRAVYHAAWKGTTREHVLRPLKLIWHRGSLYLLCLLDGVADVTTLAVQRVRHLAPTGDTFPAPRVDLEGHIRRAFGIFVSDAEEDVEIVFERDIAWRVEERTYHPDERKHRQDDGSLVYTVRSSAQWEIVPWVLSFGALAELRKPESWRQSIAETARTLADRYREPG